MMNDDDDVLGKSKNQQFFWAFGVSVLLFFCLFFGA